MLSLVFYWLLSLCSIWLSVALSVCLCLCLFVSLSRSLSLSLLSHVYSLFPNQHIGNINPAVTWALVLTRKMSCLRGVVFVISQLLGALLASAILKSLLPAAHESFLGCHTIDPQLSVRQGLAFEIVMTFIFVFVVFGTAVSPFVGKMAPLSGDEYGPGKLTPLALGLTILVLHTVGVPFTGASMNPARSFGPAVIRGDACLNNHWVYWIGPLLGATCSAIIAQTIFLSNPADMAKAFSITRGDQNLGNIHETGGKVGGAPASNNTTGAAPGTVAFSVSDDGYGKMDEQMEELDVHQ